MLVVIKDLMLFLIKESLSWTGMKTTQVRSGSWACQEAIDFVVFVFLIRLCLSSRVVVPEVELFQSKELLVLTSFPGLTYCYWLMRIIVPRTPRLAASEEVIQVRSFKAFIAEPAVREMLRPASVVTYLWLWAGLPWVAVGVAFQKRWTAHIAALLLLLWLR